MKLATSCVLLALIYSVASQSFFAFRQPKNKIVAKAPLNQNKRSGEGESQLTDGGYKDPLPDQELQLRDSTDSRKFFDISDLLETMMKDFAEIPDTMQGEELEGKSVGRDKHGGEDGEFFYV